MCNAAREKSSFMKCSQEREREKISRGEDLLLTSKSAPTSAHLPDGHLLGPQVLLDPLHGLAGLEDLLLGHGERAIRGDLGLLRRQHAVLGQRDGVVAAAQLAAQDAAPSGGVAAHLAAVAAAVGGHAGHGVAAADAMVAVDAALLRARRGRGRGRTRGGGRCRASWARAGARGPARAGVD
ncbi:hypothetical protein V2G26_017155 [Clonostachys chloroleuca]